MVQCWVQDLTKVSTLELSVNSDEACLFDLGQVSRSFLTHVDHSVRASSKAGELALVIQLAVVF